MLPVVKETPLMHLVLSEDPLELTVSNNALASCATTISTKSFPDVPANACGMRPSVPTNAC
ncbi:hypothetical protein MKW92_021709, partial [Papaver armeniacum]